MTEMKTAAKALDFEGFKKSGRNFHGRQPFKELSSSSEEEEEDIEASRNSKESSDSVEESIDPSSCSKNRE
uniref:Uncharacterized protein n=1 Tax=Solanum tuberosum TaxID=4113 RepID=M1BDX0_SOLTU